VDERASADDVRRMADALRSGGKMTTDVCPICGSPLFQLSGELRCLKCDKKVVKIKDDIEATAAGAPYVLKQMDQSVIRKIEELTIALSRAKDIDEVREAGEAIRSLLWVLSESRKLQGSSE